MSCRTLVAAVLLCIGSAGSNGQQREPPVDLYRPLDPQVVERVPIPTGYAWWSIDEISVAVLKPTSWVAEPRRDDLGGWTYTVRPATSVAAHAWGAQFTMQVFWHPGGLRGPRAARDVFRALVNGTLADGRCTIVSASTSAGPMPEVTHVRMRFRTAPPGRPPLLAHSLFVADERHGLVYVASFQAREDRWDVAWDVGSVMLERVVVGFKRPSADD